VRITRQTNRFPAPVSPCAEQHQPLDNVQADEFDVFMRLSARERLVGMDKCAIY
jgi:hypothetical protein